MRRQEREAIRHQRVGFGLAGMDEVEVRRGIEFPGADDGPLQLDLYAPSGARRADRFSAVIVGEGYPEAGFERVVGCAFREMGAVVSWARLIAASGMVAVAGSNRAPAEDARALLRFVRSSGDELGIDGERVGLWAASGNGPVALSLLFGDEGSAVRAAAFCYPFLLDLDGASEVAEAAAAYHFVDACAGRSLDELQSPPPILLARAGRDETPGLNASLDRFVVRALEQNLPLTLLDHAAGPHAFDLVHDSATTREIVRQILAFLRFHLVGGSAPKEFVSASPSQS